MKIGFLSDAHGNPEGLELCFRMLERQRVDKVYFLGDAVGYFSQWRDVLEFLKKNDVECLRGNHDQLVLENTLDDHAESAYQLRAEYRNEIESCLDWMAAWPVRREIVCDSTRILMVHGSPFDPINGYVYPWSDLSEFGSVDTDVVVMGHTHRPFLASVGKNTLLNVGSCGLPRDVGNLASFGMFDGERGQCKVFRGRMDTAKVLERVAPPHPDVLSCIQRRAESYVGTLISEQGE